MDINKDIETLYTAREAAELLKMDVSTIRRMFIDEPGVIVFGREIGTTKRRSYVTLRIPESVLKRVLRERTRK